MLKYGSQGAHLFFTLMALKINWGLLLSVAPGVHERIYLVAFDLPLLFTAITDRQILKLKLKLYDITYRTSVRRLMISFCPKYIFEDM